MTSSQTAWLYLRLLKGIATYYSYNRPAGFCATSYNSVITVYSAASGSPHDAASICLVYFYILVIYSVCYTTPLHFEDVPSSGLHNHLNVVGVFVLL